MSDSPFASLPEPTICDMNCFYEKGHDGPHQKWLGAPCDAEGCTKPAKWRRGRDVFCDDHRTRKVAEWPDLTAIKDTTGYHELRDRFDGPEDELDSILRALVNVWSGRDSQ